MPARIEEVLTTRLTPHEQVLKRSDAVITYPIPFSLFNTLTFDLNSQLQT